MANKVYIHQAIRDYIYPVSRNCIEIKLIGLKSTGAGCSIVYWNRFKDEHTAKKVLVKCFSRYNEFSYYKCLIKEDEAVKYLRYYFEIDEKDTTLYLSPNGLSTQKPSEGFYEYLYTNEKDIIEVPSWTNNAVVYQIFPERFYNGDTGNDPKDVQSWLAEPTRENFFGGDIAGIKAKLSYLSELYVDAIYLNPIFHSPSNHKYDTIDYYKIDPSFGALQDFKALVEDCHSFNIKVILDGVFNHCGYYFAPFQDVIKNGKTSKFADWFYIESYPIKTDPPNYECVGYYKWMPKLRFSNPEVREYFLGVGEYWIRKMDIDGWRLDVSDEVDFTFWQEFRRRIKSVKKNAILLGETWKDGRDLLRGDQMDSVMNYLFRDAVVDFLAKGTIDAAGFDNRIQRMLSMYSSKTIPALYNLIGSHDTARFLTLCNGNTEKLKLAVGFQMTFPGMPVIYYGDEIGMMGENDPDCRKAMLWNDMNEELLAYYKKLIRIRKSTPCLNEGDYTTIVCEDGMYGFARQSECEIVYVLLNNNENERICKLPVFNTAKPSVVSLFKSNAYENKRIRENQEFYNDDINEYFGYIEVKISGYGLEIIK